jgi:hypothetical protein
MDPDRVFLVICLTIVAVIAFNVMIYLSLRRGDEVNTVNMLRKAARRARNPWKDEDDALKELSNLVEKLKKGDMPRMESVEDQPNGDDD